MKTIYLFFFACQALHLQSETIDPEQYRNHSQVQWTWAVLSLETIELAGTENVLDVGCGDGKISALLASQLPLGSVTGIDPSERFIELARLTHQKPNLFFHNSDAQNLQFSDDFDLITAFLSLNWVSDINQALKGMYQAARPGGKSLIIVPNRPDPELMKEWRACFAQEKWQPYLHLFAKHYSRPEQEWISAVQESGWILEKWEVVKTASVFHDRQEMKDWILSLNSNLDQMPEDLLEELIDIRLEMITSTFPQAGDGRIYAFPEKINILLSKPQ